MFDGLREKLGRISEEAEEDVEEPDEDGEQADTNADAPADESQADRAAAEPDDDEATATAETAPVADDSAATESAEDGSVEDVPSEGDEATGADEATESDDEAEESDDEAEEGDDEAEEGDDGDSGRSFGERAKLFASGKTVIDEDDLQGHLDDLEMALLSSDVEMGVASEILDQVEAALVGETRRRLSSTGNLVRDALREALYDVMAVGQFDFDERVQNAEKPVVIVFTGVNGVGKTTSIAKLSRYFEERGLSTVLANGDTYRAGANEQLQMHADNLGKELISHEQGSDPAAVLYDAVEYADANDVDVVLGDTAGRLHTSDDLMAQLEKIDRVVDQDMTIFVDEAVAGQDAVNRAREFDDAATVDGAILTKADADSNGGAAISIAHVTGKPILFLGTGQEYHHLERFDPEEMVDRLLGDDE